jgi:putative ubiquitin-RnfH superfamily antitoxin RatB of RatAB toxin-antitoxin module
MIEAEVVYALPTAQRRYAVRLPDGATVRDAIESSGVLGEFGDIDLAAAKVGIFGHIVELQRPVITGDRIEIYRPLTADPKEARRRRARGA